ncbi:MAG: hypothetical protein RIS88_1172, partial [Pseudomonadota bacterium]
VEVFGVRGTERRRVAAVQQTLMVMAGLQEERV